MNSASNISVDKKAIFVQLDKICHSPEIASKRLLCKFLRYIVSEYLAGRGHQIKGYNIALDVFNRNDSFDPGQDALVRIHAGRLRRMLDLYYLKEGKKDELRIEIPKGSYIPKISVLTCEDSQNSTDNEKSNASNKLSPSLAILNFTNLSKNQDQDYFVRGFADELSIELSKYEDLILFNCNSAASDLFIRSEPFSFIRDKNIRFILEGAVEIDKKCLNVSVRLTDVSEGKQIWAQRYSENLSTESLVLVQDNITTDIAQIIGSEHGIILQKLGSEANLSSTDNINTYFAILKYYHFQIVQTPESGFVAFNALKEALRNDPQSGIATALMAAMYGSSYLLDYENAESAYQTFGDLAEKAFQIAPNCLAAKVVLSFKCFAYDERDRFFELTGQCLKQKPANSFRLGSLGMYLCLYGDWERGKSILDRLMAVNIAYPLYFHGPTSLYYYRKKDYQRALLEANKYNIPALFWGPLLRLAALGQLNEKKQVDYYKAQLLKLKPEFKSKAAYIVSRFIKEEELVIHILEGLKKAGIKIN